MTFLLYTNPKFNERREPVPPEVWWCEWLQVRNRNLQTSRSWFFMVNHVTLPETNSKCPPENGGPPQKGDSYWKPPSLGGYVSFRECKLQGCTSYPFWGGPVFFKRQNSLKQWIQLRSIIGSELCSKSSLACSRWKTTVLFRLESEKMKKKNSAMGFSWTPNNGIPLWEVSHTIPIPLP